MPGAFPVELHYTTPPTWSVPLPNKSYPREGEPTPPTSKHTRVMVGSHNEPQRGCPTHRPSAAVKGSLSHRGWGQLHTLVCLQ